MTTLPPSYDQSFNDSNPDTKSKEQEKLSNPVKVEAVVVNPNVTNGQNESISDIDPLPELEDGFQAAQESFQYKEVRKQFIKKVYIILGLQLLTTAVIVFVISYVNNKTNFAVKNVWTYWVAYIVFFVTYLTIACIPNVRRKHPHNIICLMLFTLALSYMAGMIASFHSTKSILIAFGASFVVCSAITIFAIQTKFDMTKRGMYLIVVFIVFISFCMVTCFTYYYSWYLQVVWGCLGAMVYGLFLVYRTQTVMGGHRYQLSPEEYIYGALCLYIDMVYIFLFMLGISRK